MGIGYVGSTSKPTADRIFILDLTISDSNKPLLLRNDSYVPFLLNGLFLDPNHPRADLKDDIKCWNQQNSAECLAQLALFPSGREQLLQNPAVSEALEAVSERGMSEEACDFATAALKSLRGDELQMRTEGDKHVMLSCTFGLRVCFRCCEACLMLSERDRERVPPLGVDCVPPLGVG